MTAARGTVHGGFSLVEVVVALTIFSGGIVAVAAGFSHASRHAVAAERRFQAALLAERRLHVARGEPGDRRGRTHAAGLAYSWRLETETVAPTLQRSRVEVSWEDAGRRERFHLERLQYVPGQEEVAP